MFVVRSHRSQCASVPLTQLRVATVALALLYKLYTVGSPQYFEANGVVGLGRRATHLGYRARAGEEDFESQYIYY